jgi:hypothetical protein
VANTGQLIKDARGLSRLTWSQYDRLARQVTEKLAELRGVTQ